MNKYPLKRWGVYLSLAILIVILAVSAVIFYVGSADREPQLSIRQAVNIFAQEDIHLTKTNDSGAAEINGVRPTTYFINDTKNKIDIYRYDSIDERKTAYMIYRDSDEGRGVYSNSGPNNAKNLMFIIAPVDDEQMTVKDLELLYNVSKTIFEKLNDTQEIVFSGAGNNWEALMVVKYYEYFYYGENATMKYDHNYTKSGSLKYLGQDIESVGEISYEMQCITGSGWGSRSKLKPDGTVSLGSSGGTGTIPRADQEMTFTVRWNDQEETFAARSK